MSQKQINQGFFFVVQRYRANIRTFASQNSVKKLRRGRKASRVVTPQTNKNLSIEYEGVADSSPSEDDDIQDNKKASSIDNSVVQNSITIPSRRTVLQACTFTSGLLAALGILIRQVAFTFMHH